MRNVFIWLILFFLFVFLPGGLPAVEFGLVVNQSADAGNSESKDSLFEYNALIVPRVFLLLGDGAEGSPMGSVFASAGMTLGYADNFTYIPELLRTELALQLRGLEMQLGRFGYSAPVSFLAEGLLDGIQLSHGSSLGRFKAGAWYTGFLYKKNINLTMTEYDRSVNEHPVDYNHFANTYFAPPKALASLEWEHFAIADILRVNIAASALFDLAEGLTEGQKRYNSQYLSIRGGLPVNNFFFELGGIFSIDLTESSTLTPALAGSLGVYWTVPGSFGSRLSFNMRYAGGHSNELSAFIPITTIHAGDIVEAKMSALTVLDLNYLARFTEKFGTSISARYFIRNDTVTFNTFPIMEEGEGGKMLGAEAFARLTFSPLSDLQFSLGGGAFLPSLGNNWKDEKPVWLLTASVILAVF